MYCPNCGCRVFHNDCEFCGPAEFYKESPTYCEDCGGLKTKEEDKNAR